MERRRRSHARRRRVFGQRHGRFGGRGPSGATAQGPPGEAAVPGNGDARAQPAAVTYTPTRAEPGTLGVRLGLPGRPADLQGDRRGFVLRRRLVLADASALGAAMLLVLALGGLVPGAHQPPGLELAFAAVTVPAWLLLLRASGLYHVDSRRADHGLAEEIAPVLQVSALASWGLLVLLSAIETAPVSVASCVVLWLSASALLLTFRAAARALARRRSWYRQRTLVVGTPPESAALVARIRRHPEYGLDVVACLDLSEPVTGAGPETSLGPCELSRREADVLQTIADLDVDRVVLGASVGSLCERSTLLAKLGERSVHVDLVPGWAGTVGSRLEVTEMEGMPLLMLPRTTIPRSSLLFKRLLDVAVSATLVVVLAPLFLVCALAIRLETPGPVIFRQRRVGRGGRRFAILKFRSMYRDADARKHELATLTLHRGAGAHGVFKVAEDPRVTRVGRVLRRFSLDELPQLVNVLRGDMSLVGPRPLPEDEHERITGRFRRRIDLMPGLTGLWQVHGRSDIPFQEMVDLDLRYVTNWSLWRDIELLVRTLVAVIRCRGAY